MYVFPGALIQFLNFTSEVNHDFLEVRNGPQHSSSLIGQFSGTQLPPDLLSTTHEIVIHFYTDHSQNQQGFKLAYKGESLSFYSIYLLVNFCIFLTFIISQGFFFLTEKKGYVSLRHCCSMTIVTEREGVQN